MRAADADDSHAVADNLTHGDRQRGSCIPDCRIVDQDALGVVVTVEGGRQVLEVEGNQMRGEILRRRFDDLRKLAKLNGNSHFVRTLKPSEIGGT